MSGHQCTNDAKTGRCNAEDFLNTLFTVPKDMAVDLLLKLISKSALYDESRITVNSDDIVNQLKQINLKKSTDEDASK